MNDETNVVERLREESRAVHHLADLVDRLQNEISELSHKCHLTQRQLDQDPMLWSLPKELPVEQTLPVPRIELRVYLPSDASFSGALRSVLWLVLSEGPWPKHPKIVAHPLEASIRYGSPYGESPPRDGKYFDTRYVTAARMHRDRLKIPAFCCWRDEVIEIND